MPLDLEPLLTALPGPASAGPDLSGDEAWHALEQAAAGRPETQWQAAAPPDWPTVHELALALARRTRDLRVAVWLLRSGTRLQGLRGLADGLALVRGLVERHWAVVHPAPDEDEGPDPTMRLNALTAIAHREAGLPDLRASGLVAVRGSLTLRDVELALGRAPAGAQEAVPTEAGVLEGLTRTLAQHDGLPALAVAARDDAVALERQLAKLAPKHPQPDLKPLNTLLGLLVQGLDRVRGVASGTPGTPQGTASPSPAGARHPGPPAALHTRQDVARELAALSDWLERHEPGHPAPLLMRRAQRLLDKTFLDIVRDLAPGALDDVVRIAGRASGD